MEIRYRDPGPAPVLSTPRSSRTDGGGNSRGIYAVGDGFAIPVLGAYVYMPPDVLNKVYVYFKVVAGGGYLTVIVEIKMGTGPATASVSLCRSDVYPFFVTIECE